MTGGPLSIAGTLLIHASFLLPGSWDGTSDSAPPEICGKIFSRSRAGYDRMYSFWENGSVRRSAARDARPEDLSLRGAARHNGHVDGSPAAALRAGWAPGAVPARRPSRTFPAMDQLVQIPRIDARVTDAATALNSLRQRLSPRGDIVSPQSRQRTVAVFGQPLTPQQVVERIASDVRQRGLAAVLDYTRRIDGVELTAATLRVPAEDLRAAHAAADPALLQTVRRVAQRIGQFQQSILHRDVRVDRGSEGYLAQRYVPLRRVGICVPGGAASYPSTVLMTAVPAQVAGVEQLAVVAPPTPYGADNPVLRAVCYELGIDELYRMGGAQAVVALAVGVEGVPRVDKIVGPGNLFVALAKKHVYGDVAIDALAGPSEVVVIADEGTPPQFVAADLLAQAEHAPGASILVTWSTGLAEAVGEQLQQQLATLPRGAEARDSLQSFGAVVLVRDAVQAAEVADLIAPEHLHLALRDAEALRSRIRNAGAVFVGPYSPVALGDYAAGPSHVLPTGGTARFASGLSANDFLRAHSVLHFTPQGLESLAEDVGRLAEVEGLTAHRASVEVRRGGQRSASGP